MKLNHVLVVYKRQRGRGGRGNAASALDTLKREHEQGVELVVGVIEKGGIGCRLVERAEIPHHLEADLIVSVGGDGTVLACAHAAEDSPIIGVCSMPGRSVGFFCKTIPTEFARTLKLILSGSAKPTNLPLIEARIDGDSVSPPALNDILFAGASPGETVRYSIRTGRRTESQKSSGVWIAAGPGSTAAIRSAGGRRQTPTSRRLQYVVREPYSAPKERYTLVKGLLKEGEAVTITSEMRDAMIYIDGPKITHPVPLGSKLTCRVSRRTLSIYL